MAENSLLNRRALLQGAAAPGARALFGPARPEFRPWQVLEGRKIKVEIGPDLTLRIRDRAGRTVWRTSERYKPSMNIQPDRTLELGTASRRTAGKFAEQGYRGFRLRLAWSSGADVELSVILALDRDSDELLLEVGQSGGRDRVVQVSHFYRIEKPVADGGHVVLPHGCGYLIPATMAEKLSGSGIIGYRYTLPLFGMVKGRDSFCQIVESYWDCEVAATHTPGEESVLDFAWLPSLGELRYPRRFFWRFAGDMDYVAMAKLYRARARAAGLVRTLEEKASELPAIRRYVAGVEYRWSAWRAADREAVMGDIGRLKESGLNVNFFFPKWASTGYPDEQGYSADAGWQGFLRDDPVREGWQALARFSAEARSAGAVVKVMINPNMNVEGAPGYDQAREPVRGPAKPRFPQLSPYFAPEVTRRALDRVEAAGLKFDALYFDGFSAHMGHGEDLSPQHPVSRRLGLEKQQQSFQETHRRGIIPGGELPRFWCARDCAFFFFDTGWSADLLPVGVPVPLFQLVFRDCYAACFSGGGYGRYDWPRDRHPRLFELMLGAAPGYNWSLPYVEGLPGLGLQGGVPIQDWGKEEMNNRLHWLSRWSAYYRAIAFSEMLSHEFLDPERLRQRVRFANGIVAEFDMAAGLCRIRGVPAFSGDWEAPHKGRL